MSDNVVPFRRGPGSAHTQGAVIDVYVDSGALERVCLKCGAQVGKFCLWPNGDERKTPCGPRFNPKGRK